MICPRCIYTHTPYGLFTDVASNQLQPNRHSALSRLTSNLDLHSIWLLDPSPPEELVIPTFCMETKLSIDISNMKIILVNNQNKDNPYIIYNNEPLKIWIDLNTLPLELPQIMDEMNVLLYA